MQRLVFFLEASTVALGNLLEVILLEMMEQNKLNTFQFILPTNGRLSIFQNLAYLICSLQSVGDCKTLFPTIL